MQLVSGSSDIYCNFDSVFKMTSKNYLNRVDVFYARTKDLITKYNDFKNYITHEELLRAGRFHFDQDRETYISCHALLRLILSGRLKKKPLDILFINGPYNKPGIIGNPLFFNITHTRDSFAFAISRYLSLGIDLEKVNRDLDFKSIMKISFSEKECNYVLESDSNARNRFFLLWTRKEALLKALGIGIVIDLTQVEISEHERYVNNESFGKLVFDSAFNEHFIYSKILLNYYLSIALPHKANIILNQINEENIDSYLD
jgi:phosphopantetheine--protein transferase-like protein